MGSSLHFLNIINNNKKNVYFFSGYFCIKNTVQVEELQ